MCQSTNLHKHNKFTCVLIAQLKSGENKRYYMNSSEMVPKSSPQLPLLDNDAAEDRPEFHGV